MRSHRHAIWMILAALFTVSACTAPVPEVGYNPLHPEFSSARELWEAADLVLEGTVTSSTVQELDAALTSSADEAPSPMVHTVHAVYVERVLQGTALPRTTVEVGELGGVYQGTRYTTPTGILLEQRKSYVLFLEVHDDHPASLLNPVQSVYEREGDTLRPLPGNTLPAAEVGELG